jgi:hypothetical protein
MNKKSPILWQYISFLISCHCFPVLLMSSSIWLNHPFKSFFPFNS